MFLGCIIIADDSQKFAAKEKKEGIFSSELKDDFLANMAEIVAGFCIMIIALFLLFIRKQFLIAIIACILIIVIGMEKRGSRFDRIVSIVVIMLFSIAFMML